MINTLFFDFAGVVATTKLFPKLAEIISRKTTISLDQIEEALYSDAERFVCGTQTTEEFWGEFLKPLGIEFNLFKYEMENWYELNTELLVYVDELKERGYKIHILSDNFDVCTKVMRKDIEFTKHFEKLYFSNEVNLSKSDARFFEYVINDVKVDVKESLFFDDKEKNIMMSKKIGLNGLVYRDLDVFKEELEKLLSL